MTHNLRPATPADADRLAALVDAAYGHYVERLGMLPGPMRDDYGEVVRTRGVTVATDGEAIVGAIVFGATDEGFAIENVAVDPAYQGRGLGRALIDLAEAAARREGFESVYLYTHELMTENVELYRRLGYVEYERRSEGDLARVFLRKPLS